MEGGRHSKHRDPSSGYRGILGKMTKGREVEMVGDLIELERWDTMMEEVRNVKHVNAHSWGQSDGGIVVTRAWREADVVARMGSRPNLRRRAKKV
jgi:hypothetical protein